MLKDEARYEVNTNQVNTLMNMKGRSLLSRVHPGIIVLALALSLGAIPPKLASALELKLVLIEVDNQSAEDIFVTIDNTGRIGKNITADTLKKPDGTNAPTGLLIKSKASRSFGEAIGVGDSPTLHAWKVLDDKNVAANQDFSSEKFSAKDYAVLPPKLEAKFVDGKFQKK